MSINTYDKLRVLFKAEKLAQAITITCYKIAGELNEKLHPHERATSTARWFTRLAHQAQSVMLEMRLLQVCNLQGLPEPKRPNYRRLVTPPRFSLGKLEEQAYRMGTAYNVNQVKIADALNQHIVNSLTEITDVKV
jgi:hypothetical protein